MADEFVRKEHLGGRTEVFPKSVIEIHNGRRLSVELRDDGDPVLIVRSYNSYGGDIEEIVFVEQGPDKIVVRAMRDGLTDVLGDGGVQHDDKHRVALRALLKICEDRKRMLRTDSLQEAKDMRAALFEVEDIIRKTLGDDR